MKIQTITAVAGEGGWYVDDKPAFIAGALADYYLVTGHPITPGFQRIREPGEVISVLVRLTDGTVVACDGGSVTYAGIAGRHPVFRAAVGVELVHRVVAPALVGAELRDFGELNSRLIRLSDGAGGFHTALLYAISGALLNAVAAAQRIPPARVIADEYGLSIPAGNPRIAIQTGDDRYTGVDKAIYRRVDVFPHANLKCVEDDIGTDGEKLLAYARWIVERLQQHQVPDDYHPCIHFDCYGTLGRAFEGDLQAVADYLRKLAEVVHPLQLQIEAPIEADSQDEQLRLMSALRQILADMPSPTIQIIADEWCNTASDVELFARNGAADLIQVKMPDLGSVDDSIRAALLCQQHGVGVYLGGSCNETDLSARLAVHIAIATGSDQILARPGMGVDEGVCIMRNEMARLRQLFG
jgi:methylaspartate ammonia-lyase